MIREVAPPERYERLRQLYPEPHERAKVLRVSARAIAAADRGLVRAGALSARRVRRIVEATETHGREAVIAQLGTIHRRGFVLPSSPSGSSEGE